MHFDDDDDDDDYKNHFFLSIDENLQTVRD